MCKWNYIKPLAFVLLLTVLYAFSFIIIDFIDTPSKRYIRLLHNRNEMGFRGYSHLYTFVFHKYQ